jgi:MFS family permease
MTDSVELSGPPRSKPRRLTLGLLAAASIVARMPWGMSAISYVVFVHAATSSFSDAGLVTGAYTLAFALNGPVLGRMVDRHGPGPILLPAATVSSIALIAIIPLGESGAGVIVLCLTSFVAGAATPPISGVVRRTWPTLVGAEDLRSIYLFDSIASESVFVGGPLLAGLLATAVGPTAPLVAASAIGFIGSVAFVSIPAIRARRPPTTTKRSRMGALSSPTIRYLVLTSIPLGIPFGALDVALPAFGATQGNSSLGGLFTACIAVGSITGAILLGITRKGLGDLRQTLVRLAVLQPFLSAPLLFATSIPTVAAFAMVAGSYAAPAMSVRSHIAQLKMPEGTETETFTWLLLTLMVGLSASSAIAGLLVQAGGWRLGVLFAVAAPLAWLPVVVRDRSLLPRA